jgi:hypothetical protein
LNREEAYLFRWFDCYLIASWILSFAELKALSTSLPAFSVAPSCSQPVAAAHRKNRENRKGNMTQFIFSWQ